MIAQTLASTNVRFVTLKIDIGTNNKTPVHDISLAHKMVMESANIVYQFARELRPTALAHLGLIPALHSFLKIITKRNTIYLVAQGAITNVGRHDNASRVDVTIRRRAKTVCITIADDGRFFQNGHLSSRRGNKCLGLLGMRERVGIIGGTLEIETKAWARKSSCISPSVWLS